MLVHGGVVHDRQLSRADETATPVPAKPGITQPKSGGASLDEAEACRRLTDAEERRRRSLMCDELRHAPCPIYVRPAGSAGVPVNGRVLICEISGSESVVHFSFAGTTWVSLAHGVQTHAVGADARFALQIERCLYFDDAGRRLGTQAASLAARSAMGH